MKLLPLNKGMFSQVSDQSYEGLLDKKWYEDRSYVYAFAKIDGVTKRISLHRYLMNAEPWQVVDHKDGNPLNNQLENLRICTDAENLRNKKLCKNSTTGWKGVTYEANRKKFKTSIKFNGKSYNLGRYDDPIEAAKAYDAGARKYFGEFACLNFPDA